MKHALRAPRLVLIRFASALLTVMGIAFATSDDASAEREILARVETTGEVAAQWIVILRGEHVELVHGDATPLSTGIAVRAVVDENLLDEHTLMAGVVILRDGRMASSSLEPLAFQGGGDAGIARQQLRAIITAREREREELRAALTERLNSSPLAPEIKELLNLDGEIAELDQPRLAR